MKSFKLILMTISISVAIFSANAEEKNKKAAKTGNTAKELTLKGTIMCGKCTLKKTDVCQADLEVKRKGKYGKEVTLVVLLKNDAVTMAFHKKICGGNKIAVAVTGKFEGEGKKRLPIASKIDDPPPAKKGEGQEEGLIGQPNFTARYSQN